MAIKQLFDLILPYLDEKQRRLLAGAEAIVWGSGGIAGVAEIVGMSRITVAAGISELKHPESIESERIRRPGSGRKRKAATDPTLRSDLEKLMDPVTRGEPDSPLRWTSKSSRNLAAELTKLGHPVSEYVVRGLLHEMGYSLQANRKTEEGNLPRPDRDAQFQHISTTVEEFQEKAQPVISVDTKKKELVGNYKNAGREYHPKGEPPKVLDHDFPDKELGKVSPYGVYDLLRNEAFVNLGTDHDTPAFAAQSIRSWWHTMGQEAYPTATELLITADCGGSNGARPKLWKVELQRFADESGLTITVCHFPPGTSKWNKIEHRLFSHITRNWRGRPLINHETIVNLIANTRTSTGLKVQCRLDTNAYPTGIQVSDEEMAQLNITHHESHGEWNYTLSPRNS